jgi:hypothetical protein
LHYIVLYIICVLVIIATTVVAIHVLEDYVDFYNALEETYDGEENNEKF